MLSGFSCPLDGRRVGFEVCKYSCPTRCMELPVLLSLMGSRDLKDNIYSVTEVLKPPRVVNYNRQVAHYPSPFDLMFMQIGTAFHSLVSDQMDLCPAHLFEHQLKFETEIDLGERKVILRGQPDQYNEDTETLTDYKTAGYYSVKLLLDGKWDDSDYLMQVNMYRRYRFPKCKHQQLVMLIKDYSRRLKHEGVPPIVTIPVPRLDDSEIDREVKVRMFEILDGEMDWKKSRNCTDKERWLNRKSGEYVRCEDYCVVAPDCPQWRKRD